VPSSDPVRCWNFKSLPCVSAPGTHAFSQLGPDYSIACEIANGGKRQLVIRAGKSHKFTISENEVPR